MDAPIGGYGHDHYVYVAGHRVLVGITRTLRPGAGESGAAFRRRVDDMARTLGARGGVLTVDEDLRDGILVQVWVRLHLTPLPTTPPPPARRTRRRMDMDVEVPA